MESGSSLKALDWFYTFEKVSDIIYLIKYLQSLQLNKYLQVQFITILHQPRGWLMRIKPQIWSRETALDTKAYLNEFGFAYRGEPDIYRIFYGLEQKQILVELINQHYISVVHHGQPRTKELLHFCKQVTEGLGYPPKYMR